MFGFEIFIGAIKRLLFFLTAANIDAPFCERNKTGVFLDVDSSLCGNTWGGRAYVLYVVNAPLGHAQKKGGH